MRRTYWEHAKYALSESRSYRYDVLSTIGPSYHSAALRASFFRALIEVEDNIVECR